MSEIKRVDPRRPFNITAAGLKRIVLGETGDGWSGEATDGVGVRQQRGKPPRTRQAPQRWHMAIVHADRGRLSDAARQAVAAAAILAPADTGVVVAVMGAIDEDLASLGADRVLMLPEFDARTYQPERELAAAGALVQTINPEHVFIPDNAAGTGDLGRRLAVTLGLSVATHVVEIGARQVSIRWSAGGPLAKTGLPRIVLLEPDAVDAELPFVGSAETPVPYDGAVPAVSHCCRDLGIEEQDASSIPLEEADFIVAAGNGVANVATVEALAGELGAAIGASRVAVDNGMYPREKQIGATGKTVSASAYVAVGISGAVQHLQGIKDCRYVIAINRDAGAPIVKRADLTLIGDAEDLMQAVLTRLSQARAQRELPEGS